MAKRDYTIAEIETFREYLNYSIKEGAIGWEEAEDIISRQAWDEVEEMIAKGDEYANDNEREEIN